MSETEPIRFKSGITWRSILAVVLSAVVMMPISLYLSLISGTTLASAAVFLNVILFTELSRLMGSPLSTQEVFVIYSGSGLATGAIPFLEMVYRAYYVSSPITWSFIDPLTHKPLPELIPSWYAPSSSIAKGLRTLFNPAFVFPILISSLIPGGTLWIVAEIALTLICAQVYLEVEPLEFPFALPSVQLIETLSQRDEKRVQIFVLSAFIGLFYGILLYGIPTVYFGLFNLSFQLIPFPWIDFTTGFYGIERIMPGACFGIATDILTFASGFLLPLNITVYMLIGSLLVWVFGNNLALTIFRNYFPEWSSEWTPGMNLALVYQRSYLRVWIFPFVGATLAITALEIIKGRKFFIKAIKSLSKLSSTAKSAGYPSIKTLLFMYLGSTLAGVAVFQWLVPDYPLWLSFLLSVVGSLFLALISTRAVGETGYALTVSTSNLWQLATLAINYQGIGPWLVAPVMGGTAVPGWVQTMKVAYLTETKPTDFFKIYLLAVLLTNVFSFIYVSFFWTLAPIPSSIYPWTLIQWPVNAISQSMWATRKILARYEPLLISFVGFLLLGGTGSLLSKFVGVPFSPVSLLIGMMTPPPGIVALFLGSLASKIIQRKQGDWWLNYRSVIVAGLIAGQGIVAGIAAAIVVLLRSTWLWIF